MRIISLLPSATEILYSLGLGDRLVAASHECDYPPEALRLPKATRALITGGASSAEIDFAVKERLSSGAPLYEIDAELIAELRPDLIVTQAQCDVCAVRYQDVSDLVNSDSRLHGTRIVALNPSTMADILDAIRLLGDAAGASAAARLFVASLEKRIERIRSTSAGLVRPRVVVIEWVEPLMTAGHWTPELVQWAGGSPLLAAAGEPSAYVRWSDVAAADPDVMIVSPCGYGLTRAMDELPSLERLLGWNDMRAVRDGKVFVLDGNAYLSRGGPRFVDALEILAHLLHPEVFAPPMAREGLAWASLHSKTAL